MSVQEIQEKITTLYREILFRAPDVSGLNFYTDSIINNNITLEEVSGILSSSPEASTHKLNFYKLAPNFVSIFSKDVTKNMLKSFSTWYHTFNFGNVQTTSTRTTSNYQMWCAQGIPQDLTGKTVLDVGANDGFYSFLCEQRGAKKVLAVDLDYSSKDSSKDSSTYLKFE